MRIARAVDRARTDIDSHRSMTTTIASRRRGRDARRPRAASTLRSARSDVDGHGHRNRRRSRWLQFDGAHAGAETAGPHSPAPEQRAITASILPHRPRVLDMQRASSTGSPRHTCQISYDNSDTSQHPTHPPQWHASRSTEGEATGVGRNSRVTASRQRARRRPAAACAAASTAGL